MNKFTTHALNLLAMSALAFLLTACGGGGSGGSGGGVGGSATSIGSGLSLRITDAPVNDADIAEVWVRFTQVISHLPSCSPSLHRV